MGRGPVSFMHAPVQRSEGLVAVNSGAVAGHTLLVGSVPSGVKEGYTGHEMRG